METFPCKTCAAECCGPVEITQLRLAKIKALIGRMPTEELERLGQQSRRGLDCGFLDMESKRCAVYDARPGICRAFGSLERLLCPKVTPLVTIGSSTLARMQIDDDYKSPVVMLSTNFAWKAEVR